MVFCRRRLPRSMAYYSGVRQKEYGIHAKRPNHTYCPNQSMTPQEEAQSISKHNRKPPTQFGDKIHSLNQKV
uniref:Uncharacterized protein n=1 Tax=Cucumis melo TaxID=3656 RepID=A0A9I9EGE8_CUCME